MGIRHQDHLSIFIIFFCIYTMRYHTLFESRLFICVCVSTNFKQSIDSNAIYKNYFYNVFVHLGIMVLLTPITSQPVYPTPPSLYVSQPNHGALMHLVIDFPKWIGLYGSLLYRRIWFRYGDDYGWGMIMQRVCCVKYNLCVCGSMCISAEENYIALNCIIMNVYVQYWIVINCNC